jgi:hypothetical protein
LPSLPENKNLLLAAQKQLLEPPLKMGENGFCNLYLTLVFMRSISMRKICLFTAMVLVGILSGCGQRYQTFTLLEQAEHVNEQGKEKAGDTQNNWVQRVLVDTHTGTLYYFSAPDHLEVVYQ